MKPASSPITEPSPGARPRAASALSPAERRAEIEALREADRTKARNRGRDAYDRACRLDAEGAIDEASRWMERAHRLAPGDDTVRFALATLRLRRADPAGAVLLLLPLARKLDLREAWIALALARRLQGLALDAAHALEQAIGRHVLDRRDPSLLPIATAVSREADAAGWCGMDAEGVVSVRLLDPALVVEIAVDGVVQPALGRGAGGIERHLALGPLARTGAVARIRALAGGETRRLLGADLDLAAMRQLDGCVAADGAGGLAGWAAHPRDPARVPRLFLADVEGRVHRPLAPLSADLPLDIPDRPFGLIAYGFRETAATLPPALRSGLLRVVDASGRDLPGSPIDPGLEGRAAAALARLAAGLPTQGAIPFVPVPAAHVGPPSAAARRAGRGARRRPLPAIVVPAYRDLARTLECLESVRATVPAGTEIHVVDDATPEPALARALEAEARAGRIVLHRWADGRNRGFPAAANVGLDATRGRDVVLLNSDTRVAGDWLARLERAAHAAADIGSVTPLTNEGSIVAYPKPRHPNEMPGPDETARLASLAAEANDGETMELPTGNGFCMFIRRDCLDAVGIFREDLFAQGYGEENDWCMRARHLGWRHLAALDTYVAHAGGSSFRAGRLHLIHRNLAVLNRLHPGYDALVAAHIAEDPLLPARRRLDALRFAAAIGAAPVTLLVTHQSGGGVERVIRARVREIAAAGGRAVVLRGDPELLRDDLLAIEDGAAPKRTPNLRWRLPDDAPAVHALLGGLSLAGIEIHHLLGHHPSLEALLRALAAPFDVVIHDYAAFCPRIALLGPGGVYCGEPPVEGCRRCIDIQGNLLDDTRDVDAHLAASDALLRSARRIVAPTDDAAGRIARHFPGVAVEVRPWEPEIVAAPGRAPDAADDGTLTVCVLGAIGPEKGIEVLIACARDAAARGLPLRFVVVGHTADDERVLAAGPVFVTGPYEEDEAAMLIRLHGASLAFIPSIWPETWCFTLSECWRAGLDVVAFDIGAQAERIGARGGGRLLPLGLPAPAINDALLECGRRRFVPVPAASSGESRSLARGVLATHHPA